MQLCIISLRICAYITLYRREIVGRIQHDALDAVLEGYAVVGCIWLCASIYSAVALVDCGGSSDREGWDEGLSASWDL